MEIGPGGSGGTRVARPLHRLHPPLYRYRGFPDHNLPSWSGQDPSISDHLRPAHFNLLEAVWEQGLVGRGPKSQSGCQRLAYVQFPEVAWLVQ